MTTEGRSSVRLFVFIVGLAVLVLGTVAVVTVGVSGPHVTEEPERSFHIPSGGKLVVRAVNGSITYEPWEGAELKIVATKQVAALTARMAQRIGRRVTIRFSEHMHEVRAEVVRPSLLFLGNVKVSFHVFVPREWTGDVSLTTSNGTITARGHTGNAALRTSNGGITAKGHTGSLEAHTSNGHIDLENVRGVVRAHTSNGSIRLVHGYLERVGRLRTSNGTVYAKAKLETDASYDMLTANGRITVELIDPNVSFQLYTSNGSFDVQTNIIISEVDRRRLVGRIGEGASRLNLRTSNGSIGLSTVEEGLSNETN